MYGRLPLRFSVCRVKSMEHLPYTMDRVKSMEHLPYTLDFSFDSLVTITILEDVSISVPRHFFILHEEACT